MSDYDGHDDYRKDLLAEQARVAAIESNPWTAGADKLLGYAEWGLGAGLALAAGYQTYRGICAVARCADAGFGGLAILIVASIAGLIAIGVFKALVEHWRYDWRRRLIADGAAMLATFALLLAPLHRSGQAAQTHQAEQRASRTLAENAQQKAEEAWRAGLLARGEHGPPGAVPPHLQVAHTEAGIVVTNTAKQALMVALARVREDAGATGGWQACAMRTDGTRGIGGYYYYSLAPGASATYVTLAACAAAFSDAPIEYRVGRYPGDAGWWSDSAFAAPKGRENAGGK